VGASIPQPFPVSTGARQGGVVLWLAHSCAYIDDLSVKLNKIKAGCYVKNLLNHILFVDDLCCMSPSLDGLQLLVDTCFEVANANDMLFNCSKSFGVLFSTSKMKFYRSPELTSKQ